MESLSFDHIKNFLKLRIISGVQKNRAMLGFSFFVLYYINISLVFKNMDIISHGLWGAIAFGRKNRKSFLLAFLFGVLPDLLSFGIFFVLAIFGVFERPDFGGMEPPTNEMVPSFVHSLYNVTHSLVVFLVIFVLLWVAFKRPIFVFAAWGLHILIDIPTHSSSFFPTPFLWPLSDFIIDGKSWASPYIFFPDVILLSFLYIWFFIWKRRGKDRSNKEGLK